MRQLLMNKTNANSFWRFSNIKMWILIILGILLFFPLFRYIKAQLAKNQQQSKEIEIDKRYIANMEPQNAIKAANKITTRKDIQAAAESLAKDLGTMYSSQSKWFGWLNPRAWTENDAAVAKTLLWQHRNLYEMELLYNQVYTRGMNLKRDVMTYLDSSEMAKIKKDKYIKNWL